MRTGSDIRSLWRCVADRLEEGRWGTGAVIRWERMEGCLQGGGSGGGRSGGIIHVYLRERQEREFQVVLVVKNPSANAGDARDVGLIPGSGRSPGGESGNSLWYSCLGNPMDRGAWQATVHSVTKSQTRLKRLSTHTHTHMQEKFMD